MSGPDKVVLKFLKRRREHLSMIENECVRHSALSHPNIVQLFDSFAIGPFHCLVMEYAPLGTVAHVMTGMQTTSRTLRTKRGFPMESTATDRFLRSAMSDERLTMKTTRQGLPELTVRLIVSAILKALCYLHGQDVAHCDIKLENFLAFSVGADRVVVKLADFGLSEHIPPGAVCTTSAGTAAYRSPEQLTGAKVTLATDMWSLGVAVWRMFTNAWPYPSKTSEERQRLVARPEPVPLPADPWDRYPDAKRFVTGLLNKDPAKRLTAEEALASPWLAAAAKSDAEQSVARHAISASGSIDWHDQDGSF
jgi:serine/threonine protein kinase